ncbi:MAG: TMEM165/GDT1 family protein [Candidatus Omnitrophica bacterium]|nr:TMEM165/GDT1 family protein [Candidatus Omnitrophota bacterium]
MNWPIFTATFGAIFLAELADKTQMIGISMTAKSGKPLTVFLASVSAYIVVTGLSVIIGVLLGKALRPELIRYGGGTLFILIGILMCWGKL